MPALAFRPRMPSPADPEILRIACDAIRDGHSLRATGPLAGVSRETLRSWLERGRADLEAHERDGTPVEHGSHAAFAVAIERAYADFEAENIAYVRGARSTKGAGWMPAMALMRSRHPDEWVEKPDRGGVSISIGQVTIVSLSPGQAAALGAVLLREANAASPTAQLAEGAGVATDATEGEYVELPPTPTATD